MGLTTSVTTLADAALDRSVLLGYSRIGSGLRRRWWPADPQPGCLTGRRVVVTGATSGIGEAMVRSFVQLGATVHLLGRNPEKVGRGARALRLEFGEDRIVEEVCDVSDLDAVRGWAADLTDRLEAQGGHGGLHGGLHGLVHNAGVMPTERIESAQGHEMALAAHVLGPHLMTELLLPVLGEGRGTVVFMSSGGMYSSGLRDDDLESLDGAYEGIRAYARTKRMQVVLADAWSRRLRGGDVRVESMHPGWVATDGVTASMPRFNRVLGPVLRDCVDGADTAVWLIATRPDSRAGHFWHDRAQRPTTIGWQRDEDPAKVRSFLEQVSAATGASPAW